MHLSQYLKCAAFKRGDLIKDTIIKTGILQYKTQSSVFYRKQQNDCVTWSKNALYQSHGSNWEKKTFFLWGKNLHYFYLIDTYITWLHEF